MVRLTWIYFTLNFGRHISVGRVGEYLTYSRGELRGGAWWVWVGVGGRLTHGGDDGRQQYGWRRRAELGIPDISGEGRGVVNNGDDV